MRSLLLVLLCAWTVVLSVASAANLPDEACSSLGRTILDEKKQNLIACVKCAGPAPVCATKPLIWKTMSINVLTASTAAPTSVGCSGNQILAGIAADGTPTCINPPVSDITCPSGKAVAGITNGTPYCGP